MNNKFYYLKDKYMYIYASLILKYKPRYDIFKDISLKNIQALSTTAITSAFKCTEGTKYSYYIKSDVVKLEFILPDNCLNLLSPIAIDLSYSVIPSNLVKNFKIPICTTNSKYFIECEGMIQREELINRITDSLTSRLIVLSL